MEKTIGLSFIAISLLVTSCSGKNDTTAANSSASVQSVISSQFIDAPVKGLNFSSSSNSGTTGDSGAFSCTLGELITFKIGDRSIGAAACGSKVFIDDLDSTTARKNAWGAVLQAYLSGGNIELPSAVTIATSVPNLTGDLDANVNTFFSTTGFTRPVTVSVASARTHIDSAVTSNLSLSSDVTTALNELAWFTTADGNNTDPDSARYDISQDLRILKNENTNCEVSFYLSLYAKVVTATKRFFVYPYTGTGGSHLALNGADGVMIKSDYFSTKFNVTDSGNTYSGTMSLYLDIANQKVKGRMNYTFSGGMTETCSAIINESVSVN